MALLADLETLEGRADAVVEDTTGLLDLKEEPADDIALFCWETADPVVETDRTADCADGVITAFDAEIDGEAEADNKAELPDWRTEEPEPDETATGTLDAALLDKAADEAIAIEAEAEGKLEAADCLYEDRTAELAGKAEADAIELALAEDGAELDTIAAGSKPKTCISAKPMLAVVELTVSTVSLMVVVVTGLKETVYSEPSFGSVPTLTRVPSVKARVAPVI